MPDPRQGENNCYLQVQDLKKTFMDRKRKVEAIKGISFSVAQGEMVGFLGPNGAGKTTTIKSILGLVRPDSGRITVDGIDCAKNPGEAAKRMSAVLEGARNTYWRLTVWENMQFSPEFTGSRFKERAYFEYLLEVLGLQDKRNASKKPFQRLQRRPQLRAPLSRRRPWYSWMNLLWGWMWKPHMNSGQPSGPPITGKRTIVVSSHDMKVIQDVCNRAIIISGGRIVADENIQNCCRCSEPELPDHVSRNEI